MLYAVNQDNLIKINSVSADAKKNEDKKIILIAQDKIDIFKVSRDYKTLILLLDIYKIILYNLKANVYTNFSWNEEWGKIEDILYMKKKNMLLIKIYKSSRNDIILLDINKDCYINITNNKKNVIISSMLITYDNSHVYLSDNSTGTFNIYRININDLNKELIVEIEANNVIFVE